MGGGRTGKGAKIRGVRGVCVCVEGVFCGPYLRRWVGLGDRKGGRVKLHPAGVSPRRLGGVTV